MAGGSNRPIDDLVAAQKEIIVATWKLDRRSQAASGAQSEKDIRPSRGRRRPQDAGGADVQLVPRFDDARSARAASRGPADSRRARSCQRRRCPKKTR